MGGAVEVYVKSDFSAVHSLAGYQGDSARVHGQNWIIEVFWGCQKLDEIGITIDSRDINWGVNEVLQSLDHSNLNEPGWRPPLEFQK